MRGAINGLIITMLLALAGCIGVRDGYVAECDSKDKECQKFREYPFVALRTDWKYMAEGPPRQEVPRGVAVPILILDAPISLVVDLVALPAYGVASIEGKLKPQPERQPEGRSLSAGQIGSEKAD